ncbi:MAG: AAA family ATPase [Candidatus Yanofskybacteria bacterium]|nr:AAA family ATPase [Candidatus Yanofskybacteria bacterium]
MNWSGMMETNLWSEKTISGLTEVIKKKVLGRSTPFLVAVTGISGSGKSTLCSALQQCFDSCAHLLLDGYNFEKEKRNKQKITGAHPSTFDYERARQDILSLKGWKPILAPKEPICQGITMPFSPKAITLIDGQTALLIHQWEKLYDFIVFVECPEEVLWERKKQQGDTREVFELRQKQFQEYVLPLKRKADVVVNASMR